MHRSSEGLYPVCLSQVKFVNGYEGRAFLLVTPELWISLPKGACWALFLAVGTLGKVRLVCKASKGGLN